MRGVNPHSASLWWRHQMEPFSALLALCAGNSPVPVISPHKGQWRGALMFSLICAWINDWVNNREAGDLRRHRGHYDVNVMTTYTPDWCVMGPLGPGDIISDCIMVTDAVFLLQLFLTFHNISWPWTTTCTYHVYCLGSYSQEMRYWASEVLVILLILSHSTNACSSLTNQVMCINVA